MSNTQPLGQQQQNQPSQNIQKQEQARNVDRSSKRGEMAKNQEPKKDNPNDLDAPPEDNDDDE
jgi:hypothetical protein